MKTNKILLDHGSGGKMSHSMINDIMLPMFDNRILSRLDDGAVLDILVVILVILQSTGLSMTLPCAVLSPFILVQG